MYSACDSHNSLAKLSFTRLREALNNHSWSDLDVRWDSLYTHHILTWLLHELDLFIFVGGVVDSLTIEHCEVLGLSWVVWVNWAIVAKFGLFVGVRFFISLDFFFVYNHDLSALDKVLPVLDVIFKHVEELDVDEFS